MSVTRIALFVLACAAAVGCSESRTRVEIPFQASYGGEAIACGTEADVVLTDLRFYLYGVHLIDAAGASRAVELVDDEAWQRDGLAFIDLEDGSGRCLNGTAEVNAAIRGSVPAGSYVGIGFTLGVPFELNHGDPLLADAPLGDADMHWHWRGGYKFLRAGIRTRDDGFWLHLGSTGCAGTIRNITGCTAANRVAVLLDGFVPGRDVVDVDLSALANGQALGDGMPTDCSSGPAERSCVPAFRSLGLDHAGGTAAGSQQVFVSRAAR